jgi:ubiquinone/menaquinone biosynthesis C-methylase UbiE
MKDNFSKYSEKLIQRVNELYHDSTSGDYHDSHPEIFSQEVERWRKVAKQFFTGDKPLNIVEIGSGTGFVAITIADMLKREDTFTCSDISVNMLSEAEKNIKAHNFSCSFKFVKIESRVPYHLDFQDQSADIMLMNSFLHHIKESEAFLNEIDRILKPGGLLIIAHEPNGYFFSSKFLLLNYEILNSLISPRYGVNQLLKKLHLKKLAGNIRRYFRKPAETGSSQFDLANYINQELAKESLIKEDLAMDEIERMVDIRAEEGFKPDTLLKNFKVLFLETYNHLFWVYLKFPGNKMIQSYDSYLSRMFPQKGSTFFVVLKKD